MTDKNISFQMHPAVRNPVSGCVDESNCDYEKVTMCAFNQTAVTATRVDFLICMDETNGSPALKAAEPCAKKASLDFSSVTACFHGELGMTLLTAASAVFNKALPGRTTIPHTFVGDKDVPPEYVALKDALCKAGSTAPACDDGTSHSTCTI
mmetsp:Transcript_18986/g.31794  ORF Transcript_18986/g.31794 Transcript_18986/m.31794 type:complete len:152 (-) Transcript_18986:63-518(-)|eukprot:CAMPEP_0119298828 /NCGR_PEP_ID=MMETSP1333-20130426/954_1 /TAXON_ID=418940 /ORGANISM="Scyphosphaera apsteinii, Strain RCC1455" /LENGTH=151 /DNA_ID=CAMNT_0007300029 /DNA_START=157 /DNA_END=612 /DNA_ORIENTATION=+